MPCLIFVQVGELVKNFRKAVKAADKPAGKKDWEAFLVSHKVRILRCLPRELQPSCSPIHTAARIELPN